MICSSSPDRRQQSIAVIGTGIAGMSAAWLLNQSSRITVYEKNDRVGGHSNTVDAPLSRGSMPVDTGFIVYNERNYPNLTALFRHLDVPTKNSEMSFSASLRGGAFEYAGTDLNGLLGQRTNIVNPRFWVMVADILKFYREAPLFLARGSSQNTSLGEFLRRGGYGDAFVQDHLLPMGAAIWSTTAAEISAYPAAAFIRFFASHGLMEIRDRPQWRTVDGGSREYVKRLTAPYDKHIRRAGATRIEREKNGVVVRDASGETKRYDHVVIATHADEALSLMSDADSRERDHLACWRYTQNRAVLHRDPALMPKRRRTWSSWNFIGGASDSSDTPLCVTYWMNRLQGLETNENLFVTLNPVREPAPEMVIGAFDYSHPYFDCAALESQRRLWAIQGHRNTWYCGSYFGYGFHEDALQSGLAVAEQLGGMRRPWRVDGECNRIFLSDKQRAAA